MKELRATIKRLEREIEAYKAERTKKDHIIKEQWEIIKGLRKLKETI